MSNEIWLLTHPSQYNLSKRIENDSKNIVLKDIIKWKKFENNYPNLYIKDVKQLIGKDVLFLCNLSSPELMFEQLSVINALPKYLVGSLTILLPFFPCGTMEKIEYEGQIATAKTIANILSIIPMSKYGPAQMVIYDIHALQERFYFGDSIIPRLETAVPLLYNELNRLVTEPGISNICIVFPDDGARKRFSAYFTTNHWMESKDHDSSMLDNDVGIVDKILICSKTRLEHGKYDVQLIGDLPTDCHVVIVDDLINTGGTVLECTKKCFEKQAKQVSVFVTHGVFPQNSWQKFMYPLMIGNVERKISNFWITDSIPHESDIFNSANKDNIFKLLSLSKLFADLF